MNADDVRAAMQKNFTPPDSEIVFEVAHDLGFDKRQRFCDAMVLRMWSSRDYEVEGFEIKVSRSDWMRELGMPGKADPHFARCDRWWLITPAHTARIAKIEEIPGPWGWMEVQKDQSLRVIKKAPKLVPTSPKNWTFALALLRAAGKMHAAEVEHRVAARLATADVDFTSKVNARAASLLGEAAQLDRQRIDRMAKIEKAFGSGEWLDDEKILDALGKVHQLHKNTKGLARYLTQLGELDAGLKLAGTGVTNAIEAMRALPKVKAT